MWPGADDAHVARQDVENLRQLVDAGPADEASYPGDAIIVPFGRAMPCTIGTVDPHAAKLLDTEHLIAPSDPGLREQDRAWRVALDQQRDDDEQR